MSQRTQVSTKKANRSVNGKNQTTKVAIAPTPKVPDTLTPLGDAVRKSGPYGEMLVENIEGLDYYQKAKSHISDLFINYMAFSEDGEMSDSFKQLHVGLHTCIQDLLDNLHREYIYGLREKSLRDYEEILGKSLSTENFA